MQNTKFSAILLIIVTLAGILSSSPAISSLINSVIIRSTGEVSSPLATARSGSARDIQAAVDWVAATGDGIGNVSIPEGTFNFVEVGEEWMTVEIPAGINLFGAATERDANGQVIEWKTILVMPWDVPGNASVGIPNWFEIVGNADPNKPSRFSDIKLVGYRDFDPNSTSMHRAVVVESVIDFRIDHCFFKHTAAGGVLVQGLYFRGVIDHCKLINEYGVPVPYEEATIGYGVHVTRGWETTEWEDDINKVLGKYLNYTVFIEDNYFSKWRHCVASNNGAHYVFRHNTVKNDFGYGSLDAHGTYTNIGTRAIEVYENEFLDAMPVGTGIKDAIWFRGGGGVVFNNRVTGYERLAYLVNEGEVEKCYPHDIWVWDNDLPAGVSPVVVYTDPEKGGAVENIDYFLYAKPDYVPYSYPHPLTLETTP